VAEAAQQPRLRDSFERGFSAGLIVLVLWFIIRLGGLAPYPPESALVSFFSVIPESIQEPAVQALGEAAGLLGLVIAVALAAILYGLLAVGFERYFLPKASVTRWMSRLESTLIFTAVPWLLFGLVILPLTGESFFGLNSNIASGTVAMAFPFATLLIQLLWGVLLFARTPSGTATPAKVGVGPTEGMVPKDVDRRTFIERGLVLAGSAVLVLASLGSAVGALISEGGLLSLGGVSIRPGASINAGNVPLIFSDPRLGSLVNSEVTNNNSFYRVAIDIFDPNVSTSEWSLGLSGLVAKPKNYSFVDLQNLPKSQQYSTFICVSNVVNGDLISNAKWGGVRLSDLFEDAGGVLPSAAYVVFHSVDGYSVGIPIAKALEQGSMLAYEMNDAALPQRHGYPLRAVIPGLYGMMSAKWIRHIELTDGVYLGYWQTRGWSNDATVQTAVFIRIPQDGASVSLSQNNGTVILGGMAFAGDRGVSKVEVSVDGGKTWKEATLKPTASSLAWVLWAYEWIPPSVGQYTVYARATDGDGQAQSSAQSTPFPSGATGYSMSTLTVVS
jgi:DMSO/TMAO reductase YedYZ molybdopterin-dependent catalytic subunit